MKNSKNLFISFLFAAFVLALSACGSDVYDATLPAAARVKIVHTLSDSSANLIDALVDGTKIGFKTGIPDTLKFGTTYPTDSTYLRFTEGAHNVKILPLGGTTGFTGDVTLAANTSYSIFAIDSLPAIGGLVVKDDFPAAQAGKIVIRLVNLSPNAPAYDLGVKGGSVLNSNVAYKAASAFVQADIPVGNDTLKLEVRPTGTATAAVSFNIIKPTAGRIFTILTKGYVGGRKASYRLSTTTLNNSR